MDVEKKVRKAQILRNGNDGQRERGYELLREVITTGEGTTHAQHASEILSEKERPALVRVDPELQELSDLLPAIQGFSDYRLSDFLRRLESHGAIAVPLRNEFIKELRKWIADALPQLKSGTVNVPIPAMNTFVAHVRGVTAYETVPEIRQLRDALFYPLLRDTAARIDDALKSWTISKAFDFLEDLKSPPEAFESNVKELEVQILEVEFLCNTVDRLEKKASSLAPPSKWFDAREEHAQILRQLHQQLKGLKIPPDRQFRLEQAQTNLVEDLESFVRAEAEAAKSIDQLRTFWTEFKQLPEETISYDQGGENWFESALETLHWATSRDVERAGNPRDLYKVSKSLRGQNYDLPPVVYDWVEKTARVVDTIAKAWESMLAGQTFELGGANEVTVPGAYREKSAQYSEWLKRIGTELDNFKKQLCSLEDFERALRLAEEILAEAPAHALALKLQQESSRRFSSYKLDQALTDWSLGTFFDLLNLCNPGEIYSALANHKEALVELGTLRNAAVITNWQGAREWWTAWRKAGRQLPAAKADALSKALALHTKERRKEWYATLAKALKDSLSAEEYEACAASLKGEEDPNLKTSDLLTYPSMNLSAFRCC